MSVTLNTPVGVIRQHAARAREDAAKMRAEAARLIKVAEQVEARTVEFDLAGDLLEQGTR